MEEMNNNINPNQQPQPQKEEEEKKKKNKFVAWWLGLGKWAKVGICAGTAAVVATAITLPIVLTNNKGNGQSEIILKKTLGGYTVENPINLKKDTQYTFKTEAIDAEMNLTRFQISYNETWYAEMSSASLEGVQNNWKLSDDKYALTGTEITKESAKGKILTIKVVLNEDVNQSSPSLLVGGE